MEKLYKLIQQLIDDQLIISIVLSDKRKKSQIYRRFTIRPVLSPANMLFYQAELLLDTKVTHQNFAGDDSDALLHFIDEGLSAHFKQAVIFSVEADYHVHAVKPERPKIIKKPPAKKQTALSHDRIKRHILADGIPCDFLIRLGVMSKDGKVLKSHYNKFRQINRFLEIVSDVLESLPRTDGRPLRIIDFGCGKAYLTFALYYYLRDIAGFDPQITGLDLKEDVIHFCRQIASDLNYTGLYFMPGDIATYHPDLLSGIDMVVTLHACDTATDHALINAVRWGANVILSVPCCQHELMSQIRNDTHRTMFKHGILKERFSALLTDGLRALQLEAVGYDVSLIEFTSLEHTAKNIMIRGAKPPQGASLQSKEQALVAYKSLCDFWQVNPSIDLLSSQEIR